MKTLVFAFVDNLNWNSVLTTWFVSGELVAGIASLNKSSLMWRIQAQCPAALLFVIGENRKLKNVELWFLMVWSVTSSSECALRQ